MKHLMRWPQAVETFLLLTLISTGKSNKLLSLELTASSMAASIMTLGIIALPLMFCRIGKIGTDGQIVLCTALK